MYDILPSITVVLILVTPQGPENCQLTSSFVVVVGGGGGGVGVQTVVSLIVLQTTQIISDVLFYDHVAYAS